MNNLIVLPVVLPLLTGIILVFLQNARVAQRIIAAAGSSASLIAAALLTYAVGTGGIMVLQVGGWPAPFGISLVADMFAALMLLAANVVVLSCLFYSFGVIEESALRHYFYPLVLFLLTGVSGSFLTGDIFNLFVFFEVTLASSYVLIVFGGTKPRLQESIKYVVVNLFSSALFVAAIAYLYSMAGTLNMADLSVKIGAANQAGLLNAVAMLFFVVFAIKAAIFPFYLWLPGAYSAPLLPVAALFGALLTKVGIYSLIRVFTLVFVGNPAFTHSLFIWAAAVTLVLGVLGAVSSTDIRKILAYNVIVAVGFMLMGLGIFTGTSIAGTLYYMAHDIIIKGALFLLAGSIIGAAGTGDLNRMGGLIKKNPALGWLFLVASLALVGIPPMGGFIGKLLLIVGGAQAGQYVIVAAALLVSLLMLHAILRVFIFGFWGEGEAWAPQSAQAHTGQNKAGALLVPAALLLLLSVMLGVGAQLFYPLVEMAARQLINPGEYVGAVLGGM